MNAERLHAIAIVLQREMNSINTVGKLEAMCSSLEQQVNQNHPQHQQNLAANLTALYASLDNNLTDNFSPAWKQLLSELLQVKPFDFRTREISEVKQPRFLTGASNSRHLENERPVSIETTAVPQSYSVRCLLIFISLLIMQ